MKRSDLLKLVVDAGGKVADGRPRIKKKLRKNLEAKLRAYFRTPQGREQLARAPRVYWDDQGLQGMKPMDEDYAIQALMEEVEDDEE